MRKHSLLSEQPSYFIFLCLMYCSRQHLLSDIFATSHQWKRSNDRWWKQHGYVLSWLSHHDSSSPFSV